MHFNAKFWLHNLNLNVSLAYYATLRFENDDKMPVEMPNHLDAFENLI